MLDDIGRFMLIEQLPCLPVFFLANGDSQAFIAGRGTHSFSESKVILGLVPSSEAFIFDLHVEEPAVSVVQADAPFSSCCS